MENSVCMVARALKPSLRGELSMKPFNTQQVFVDELSSLNTQNGAVSGEEYFSVDCFLDLPVGHEEEEEDEEEKDSVSISSQEEKDSVSISSQEEKDYIFIKKLTDEELAALAELEWVSQIMDDSSSEFSLLYPPAAIKESSLVRFDPETESRELITTSTSNNNRRVPFLFPYQLPGKPRTKRPRPTSLSTNWSVGPSLTQSSSSSCLTPTSSSVSNGPFIISDYCINMVGIVDQVNEPASKKPKREPPVRGLTQFQRRCSHCLVQKTPQWRAGPLGPKTLCNACGVRYKSGRLFPEYRPACSPTFSGDIHSNSHRKVLEMRRRKEVAQPVSGLSQMVPGF